MEKPIFVREFYFLKRYDMKTRRRQHTAIGPQHLSCGQFLVLGADDEVNIAKGAECSFNGGQIIQMSDL